MEVFNAAAASLPIVTGDTGSNSTKLISFQKLPLTECPACPLSVRDKYTFLLCLHGRQGCYTTGSQFSCMFKSLQETYFFFYPDTQEKAQANYVTSFGLESRYFTSL